MEVASKYETLVSVDEILDAQKRLSGIALKSPYLWNYNLSNEYRCNIWLKREDLQVVRSFKIRGAYNKIKSLNNDELKAGVVCASAGNHAQGVAFSCAQLDIKGTIVMPSTTPRQKVKKVEHFGKGNVDIILQGDNFDDAYQVAMNIQRLKKATFIHPFDDDHIIAGQGTIACEIIEEIESPLDYLFVAVGGGGLISGILSYMKKVSPSTKIIAVEAAGAPALYKSVMEGERVLLDSIDGFADGVAVKQIGKRTFDICREYVDDFVLVEEGAICSAILNLYNDEAIVAEPAGALGIAALEQCKDQIKGKNVGIIICGGNNDVARTEEIRERALLWERKKHYFIIRFPQRAGALKEFLSVLGPEDDITHFEYTKKNNRSSGPALVGVELQDKSDFDGLISRMKERNINFEHINNSPILFEWII